MIKFKPFVATIVATSLLLIATGCTRQSYTVSENLSQEADNFNIVRQITVINCIQGDVLFQMTGRCSIEADTVDNQLEIVVEVEKGVYKKHFIGLSDNVTYTVEQVEASETDPYNYELNFNPKMWLPYTIENID